MYRIFRHSIKYFVTFICFWILEQQEIFTDVILAAEHFRLETPLQDSFLRAAFETYLKCVARTAGQKARGYEWASFLKEVALPQTVSQSLIPVCLLWMWLRLCGYEASPPPSSISWFDLGLGKDAAPPSLRFLAGNPGVLIWFPGWRRPCRKARPVFIIGFPVTRGTNQEGDAWVCYQVVEMSLRRCVILFACLHPCGPR